MLKFNIRRSPFSDHSYFAEKDIQASLFVENWNEDQKWLQLRFSTGTNARTSIFEGALYPHNFAVLPEMMMEADPEAAIRAFGKAMTAVKIQRRDDPVASDEAA